MDKKPFAKLLSIHLSTKTVLL